MSIDWVTLASIAAVLTTIVVAALWLGRQGLGPFFVGRREHTALETRVIELEKLARSAATRADIATVYDRLAVVEQSSAANGATLTGVQDGVRRIEHQLNMLVEHALNKDRP